MVYLVEGLARPIQPGDSLILFCTIPTQVQVTVFRKKVSQESHVVIHTVYHFHSDAEQHLRQKSAQNTGQRNWPIVCGITFITLFEQRGHPCLCPIFWQLTCLF